MTPRKPSTDCRKVVGENDPLFVPTAVRRVNICPNALVHERAKQAADEDGRSFSDYCVGLLRRDLIAQGLLKEGEGR